MKHIVSTLILADDELSRAGLLGILAGARFRPMAAKGGWDAIVASGKSLPEIVVLILSGTMTDPEATSGKIEPIAKRSKVVVLADHCEAKLVRSAICAGAAAFLPRSISGGVLVQTLDLVLEGEIILPAAVARDVLTCAQLESERNASGSSDPSGSTERVGRLSSREVDILKRLVHGDSNKQISRQLEISETTVKVHVKAILRKIRVCNRTQAAIWGIDNLSNLTGTGCAPSDASKAIVSEAPLVPNKVPPVVVESRRNGHGRSVARSSAA
ncbi:MAG: response regulator transcription factor [Xanthobacteraceae bacterium]|nr:response regulator transcription factor [Xanthobacteraceae bacterium]